MSKIDELVSLTEEVMNEGIKKFKKAHDFSSANLELIGAGMDRNGNHVAQVKFYNAKSGFSIQTSQNLPHAHRNLRGVKNLSELSDSDLNLIEMEIVDYIRNYGSAKQKSSLRTN